MLGKLKAVFGWNGVQEVIAVEKEIVEDKVKDISSPVYTIVEKVKEDPSRLRFSECYGDLFGNTLTTQTMVLDSITSDVCSCYITNKPRVYNGEGTSYTLVSDKVNFTKDEIDYITFSLVPIYKERASRLQKIRTLRKERQELRNREAMQKKWEES